MVWGPGVESLWPASVSRSSTIQVRSWSAGAESDWVCGRRDRGLECGVAFQGCSA